MKGDILGSRRKIVFVEGTAQSLDAPLYSLLFPQISIVPKKGGCREVEYAVRGLRGAGDIHWISAWGIVDNDQRSAEDVARLKKAGVWAKRLKEDTYVQSIESSGPSVAPAGAWLCIGTEGEPWSVTSEWFHTRYIVPDRHASKPM